MCITSFLNGIMCRNIATGGVSEAAFWTVPARYRKGPLSQRSAIAKVRYRKGPGLGLGLGLGLVRVRVRVRVRVSLPLTPTI